MKKYFAILLVLVLLVLAAACSNKVQEPLDANPPIQNNTDQQAENETSNEYTDLGGANDIKLYPIDEASQNADFESFRNELLEAVKQKDLEFLKEHIDENIKYSFGANDKITGFLKEWNLNTNPNESRLWDELNKVLLLGGTFNDNEKTLFTAPYVFTKFPEDIDAFQYLAIIDENVKIYTDSDINSKIEGELNYSIVKLLERDDKPIEINGETTSWIKVETLSGNSGFILDKYARSPIDYRASFKNINGTWKLMFFVAGD